MASGYQINGVDLDDLCEPKFSNGNSALTTDPNSSTSMMNYYNNNEHFGNRYSRANTDSWAKTIELPFYGKGYPFKVVQKGCLPTQTMFAEITSAGTYSISRTDSALTIGSTTYPASHFRNGVVPKYIGVMICGGGGGAGGWGCEEGDKDGYNVTPAGSGGGGGIALGVVNLTSLTSITIGSGGGGGSNGSGDSRPSSGSNGGNGGTSTINTTVGTITAVGGYGGSAGTGSTVGSGGEGGYGSGSLTDGAYITMVRGGYGGASRDEEGGYGVSLTGFSFTNGAGIDTTTMFSSSNTGYSHTSGDSYRDSWAGGGGSIGTGATNSSSASKGGGGSHGKHSYKNGASGYCAFYY